MRPSNGIDNSLGSRLACPNFDTCLFLFEAVRVDSIVGVVKVEVACRHHGCVDALATFVITNRLGSTCD